MPSVTRKAQSNRRQRRAEIEKQLLEATERLMSEGTAFTELSVDRLATEAGISRATFYVYFQDKGQLLRRLTEQVFAEFLDSARTWWDVVERHDATDLRKAMSAIITTYRTHQALVTAVIEMAAYDPQVSESYDRLLSSAIDSLERIIERGKADGAIRPQLPSRATAGGLTWAVERTVFQSAHVSGPEHDAQLADALTEIVWSTLYLETAADSTDRLRSGG
ncbi:TetR/AcrR family transcriptional regulator [Streptomyces sp. NPDC052309]|uniref:TetR/AcrR family transcriptional regulator n=1 Tax=Streptomyces sp. NPDC052309 TaxID=3155421 RepID=UPI00343A628E